jgi:very-short-patch-repair endonuclease
MTDKYNDSLHFGARKDLYGFGRELRKRSTSAERRLWSYLRNRKLDGFKFRRQHPLGEYIPDFYCHEKNLAVECDGSVHDGKFNENYDQVRSEELFRSGILIIRFRNEIIMTNIDFVLNTIKKKLRDL